MSASLQTCQRQQDYVLQRSEKFSTFHLFCNIEQISPSGQAVKRQKPDTARGHSFQIHSKEAARGLQLGVSDAGF